MSALSEFAERINTALNAFAWGKGMLVLLTGCGVWITLRTRFIQLRAFPAALRLCRDALVSRRDDGKNLSSFQAFSTALAGSVGTGNIAGVTLALFTGGPGAVFWMWLSAFFGMATKYAEIALSVKYRVRDGSGRYRGGAMYYIVGGLGGAWRWLAEAFALFGGLACFGIGNIAQSCEIAAAAKELLGWRPALTGAILAALTALVILGGARRVGRITARVVPFMGLLYLLTGLAVIALRASLVPAAFAAIFRGAFSPTAAGGGIAGYGLREAVRHGVSRGVFSNEAGLGSAPFAHGASAAASPAKEGLWGILEVFADTFVICTVTALTVLLSGVLDLPSGLDAFPSPGAAAVASFDSILPGGAGGVILRVCLLFFAFSTILSWSLYGEACWRFLLGESAFVKGLFRALFIAVCFLGAIGSGSFLWTLSDTLNGLMAIPNLVALIPLSGEVARLCPSPSPKKGTA